MTTIDIVILVVLALGAFFGFKRGFIKETVSFLGFVFAVVVSFLLKDQVSVFLYSHLPFFKFGGIVKGVTALNILVYECNEQLQRQEEKISELEELKSQKEVQYLLIIVQ